MPSPSKRKTPAAKPPKAGEQTGAQLPKGNNVYNFLSAGGEGVKGFKPPPEGTFKTYREICRYPTIALGLQKIVGPIADAPVSWEKRDDTVDDEWSDFISGMFDPTMPQTLETGMLAVRYGFSPFEKIWAEKDGRWVIEELKALLVDATEYLYDEKGHLKGLRNKPSNKEAVDLPMNKCFAFALAGEAGNPYGTSRLENVRERWAEVKQIIERFAKYLAKVAAVIGQIHYPDGQSADVNGAMTPNAWIAAQIAADAAAGRWLLIPNKFASFLSTGEVSGAVMEKALAAAGKSEWVVSFLDPGGTDFAPGFTAALEYYDKLLLRGLYLPERAVIEGQHGTKADAGTHDEMTVLDASGLYRKFVREFNARVVDEVLVLNFGEAARGAVFAQAPPLADENGATRLATLTALLNSADPAIARAAARKIDLVSLMEDEEIPVVDGEEKSTLADAIDEAAKQEQADKEQAAQAQADALKLKAQQPTVAPPAKGKGGGATAKMLSRWVEGETLNMGRDGDESGHWVTMEGEHVLIRGGRIAKGPAALLWKKPSELPERSALHHKVSDHAESYHAAVKERPAEKAPEHHEEKKPEAASDTPTIDVNKSKFAGKLIGSHGKELGPDDEVKVFHVTNEATAHRMLAGGVHPHEKATGGKTIITDEATAKALGKKVGDALDYEPGRGQGKGLYVGPDADSLKHYGTHVIAVKAKVKDLAVPPERASVHRMTPAKSLMLDDGYLEGHVPASSLSLHATNAPSAPAAPPEPAKAAEGKATLPEHVNPADLAHMDAKLARLEKKMERTRKVWDKPNETPGPMVTGSSNYTQGKKLDAENDRKADAFREHQKAEQEHRFLKANREGYIAGTNHPNGQPRVAGAVEARQAAKERNDAKIEAQGYSTRKIHSDLGMDGHSKLADGRVVSYEAQLMDEPPKGGYRLVITNPDGKVTTGKFHGSISKMQAGGELKKLLSGK